MGLSKNQWLVPLSLVLLCAAPIGAGVYRLVALTAGTEISPTNARFFENPAPVVIHILSTCIFCFIGAFQVVPRFRRGGIKLHRAMGWLAGPCGILSAATGIWLTLVYPPVENDGPLLFVIRMLAGFAMLAVIALSLAAIVKGNIASHRVWMLRGFALATGVGTQAYLIGLWMLLFGETGELARACLFGAGWAINLAVAEWMIATRSKQTRPRSFSQQAA